jgi:HD-like signal output (HDOD) protein
MLAGTAAKRIAEDLGFRIGSEAFVAGLIHDLGLPVMHKFFKDDFEKIVNDFHDVNAPILESERKYLGMDHQEIGFFLANKWSLPEHLSNAILNHHKPSSAEETDILTSIVHLVDYMTQKLEIGDYYLDTGYEFDEGVLEVLGIASVEDLEVFIEGYRELFNEELDSDLFNS